MGPRKKPVFRVEEDDTSLLLTWSSLSCTKILPRLRGVEGAKDDRPVPLSPSSLILSLHPCCLWGILHHRFR